MLYKVGFIHRGYNEKRNIFGIKSTDCVHKKVFDLFKIFDYLYFKIYKKTNLFYHNSFNDKYSFPKVDIYHFFNAVNYGNKPWICTFETILPRYKPNSKFTDKALKAIAKPNCKKLIAFSEFNKKLQVDFIKDFYPKYIDIILPKIEVIYPPQKVINENNLSRFDNIKPLKILFIGHDFFRKGGREVFLAIERLVSEGRQIELMIVSKLNTDNWVSFTNKSDSDEWKQKLKTAKFCNHYEQLANEKVMDLLKNTHLLVLPSLQETFGYAVLEAQACGTPVVTTNIRAFPEINNNDCGWLINVPQTEKGSADVYSNGYEYLSKIVITELYNNLKEVFANPEIMKLKSLKAIDRIKNNHDLKIFSKKLNEIYNGALKG